MAEELKNGSNEGQNTDTQTQTTEVTYTQAQVDEMLQKEADRRVTMALKKAEEKNKASIREAQKLAQMNESQKYEYELQQREAAIEAKERQLALSENKNVASKILAEKGLSLDLVQFVVAEDAETMDNNIKALDKAFKLSVKNEVEKRLASKTPTQSLPGALSGVTKEQFKKMTMVEMMQLKNEQPELFESFANSMY